MNARARSETIDGPVHRQAVRGVSGLPRKSSPGSRVFTTLGQTRAWETKSRSPPRLRILSLTMTLTRRGPRGSSEHMRFRFFIRTALSHDSLVAQARQKQTRQSWRNIRKSAGQVVETRLTWASRIFEPCIKCRSAHVNGVADSRANTTSARTSGKPLISLSEV